MSNIKNLINEYNELGISQQLDYDRLYLYSIITHSTAIEGSTVSDLENQLLFDDGISPDRPIMEQLMNLDLKKAYERAFAIADEHVKITTDLLCELSGYVMKNTGSLYDTIAGRFDSARGELRLLNVSAGRGGKSYMAWQKVPVRLEEFCTWLNAGRDKLINGTDKDARDATKTGRDATEIYEFSFEAHYRLVQIHPWADGNGRMARLVMNMIQREAGVVPSIVNKEKRAEYIKSLAESQAAESIAGFMGFMLSHHENNLQEQIREYRESVEDDVIAGVGATNYYKFDNYTGSDAIQVKESKSLNYSGLSAKEQVVLDEIANCPDITINEIVSRNGFSRPTVTRALKVLKESGRVTRVGSKKTGRWEV